MYQHRPTFRSRLLAGDLLIGTIVSVASPVVAEITAKSGPDWLFIDGEHGALSVPDIQAILQAAQPYCPCLVRIPAAEEVAVKQIMDLGVDGIIVPLVNDSETAAHVVSAAKYPPDGTRSVGIGRAHAYGPDHAAYLARANRDIAVVVQIEHKTAVENLDSILSVDGVDAVFVGPYDLSGSLGIPGQINDSQVQNRIDTVRELCTEQNVPVGIFGADAEAVRPRIAEGFTLITTGVDTSLLAGAVSSLIGTVRE